LATPGNRVALLEFDMRLPAIFRMLDLDHKAGLSEYLAGEVSSLCAIRHESSVIKGLDIYPSGKTPSNPADLLLSERLPGIIAELRKQYQHIIIDTAPAGLVTDAFILGRHCDVVVYVVRHNHTLKKHLENMNDIYKLGKFSNLCIVFNDIRTGGKYGFGYEYYKAYESDAGYDKGRGLFRRVSALTRSGEQPAGKLNNV
jgi:capsular exopolysaccharide synthesis family protein